MTSKRPALSCWSGAAFEGVKWSLSLAGALVASLFVVLLETQS
jgi:hypothetical protein